MLSLTGSISLMKVGSQLSEGRLAGSRAFVDS